MLELLGNLIVGFPMRQLMCLFLAVPGILISGLEFIKLFFMLNSAEHEI